MKVFLRRSSLCLLLLAALVSVAQDSSDDDSDGYTGVENLATLSLSFDSQGSVDATLDLSNKAESMEALRTTMAQALHCAGRTV